MVVWITSPRVIPHNAAMSSRSTPDISPPVAIFKEIPIPANREPFHNCSFCGANLTAPHSPQVSTSHSILPHAQGCPFCGVLLDATIQICRPPHVIGRPPLNSKDSVFDSTNRCMTYQSPSWHCLVCCLACCLQYSFSIWPSIVPIARPSTHQVRLPRHCRDHLPKCTSIIHRVTSSFMPLP